jgi:hypothetical protein
MDLYKNVSTISVFKDLKPLPIFYPTKEDFEDFKSYILKIHKESMEYGSCRIVPPKYWFEFLNLLTNRKPNDSMNATFESYDEKFNISEMEIDPIFQILQGKRGLYQVTPNRASEMKVSDFKSKSESNEPKWKEDLEKVDELFWKNLENDSPLYAYDIPKTLFKNGVHWDLNNLENLLGYIRCEIPGVTTPYLYFGSWKSNFSWHVEDMNLYSISYLQFYFYLFLNS